MDTRGADRHHDRRSRAIRLFADAAASRSAVDRLRALPTRHSRPRLHRPASSYVDADGRRADYSGCVPRVRRDMERLWRRLLAENIRNADHEQPMDDERSRCEGTDCGARSRLRRCGRHPVVPRPTGRARRDHRDAASCRRWSRAAADSDRRRRVRVGVSHGERAAHEHHSERLQRSRGKRQPRLSAARRFVDNGRLLVEFHGR